MHYEPHTKHVAPDEQLELPPGAVGINVTRSADSFGIHYLAPVETEGEQQLDVPDAVEDRIEQVSRLGVQRQSSHQ